MACWFLWHQIFETDRRNVKKKIWYLSDVFLHVCEEERWHVLQKLIDEVHKSRHWSFPSLTAAQQNNGWKSIIRCWEFYKTIDSFAHVGFEIGEGQLSATRLVGYLPSRIQRGLMEQLLIAPFWWCLHYYHDVFCFIDSFRENARFVKLNFPFYPHVFQ